MDLEFRDDVMETSAYSSNCPLSIVDLSHVKETKTYECCPEPYVSLLMTFTVKRNYMIGKDGGVIRNPNMYP